MHPFVRANQMLGRTTKSIAVFVRMGNLFIQNYNTILPSTEVSFKRFMW